MRQLVINKMVLITIILIEFLTGMELDLFIPSFPELRSQFNLSPFLVEMLLSINFIGYCLSLFYVGSFTDRYGRKSVMLVGQIVFIIGSILCLWPLFWNFLIIGRFLQGVGIAAPAIVSFLIIADRYPVKQQQFFMGVLNGFINIAVGVAPIIGSYLTFYFHWQGNFSALLLFGIVTFIMTIFFIPSYKFKHDASLSFKYVDIFKSKPLLTLIAHIVFMLIPYWVFIGISPMLYMESFGVSLKYFGYYQGVLAIIYAFGSMLFGLLIRHVNYEMTKMLKVALGMLIVSLIALLFVTFANSHNPLVITICFIPFIIGQIIPCVLLYPLSLNYLPEAKGKISAVIQGGRLVLSALFLQVAGYFYVGSFRNIGIVLCTLIFISIMFLYKTFQYQNLINQKE